MPLSSVIFWGMEMKSIESCLTEGKITQLWSFN